MTQLNLLAQALPAPLPTCWAIVTGNTVHVLQICESSGWHTPKCLHSWEDCKAHCVTVSWEVKTQTQKQVDSWPPDYPLKRSIPRTGFWGCRSRIQVLDPRWAPAGLHPFPCWMKWALPLCIAPESEQPCRAAFMKTSDSLASMQPPGLAACVQGLWPAPTQGQVFLVNLIKAVVFNAVLWEELCLPQQAVNILQQRCFTVLMTLYHRKFEAPCAASRSHMLSRFLGPVQLNPPKEMYPILYPRVCYCERRGHGLDTTWNYGGHKSKLATIPLSDSLCI